MESKIKESEEKLLRKEQKCKELNERSVGFARKCQKLELDVCHLKDKNYNLQRQLDQLEAENEELKNRSDEWMAKCEQETKLREFIGEQLNQLQQTLAEIEDLARQEVVCDNCNFQGTDKCDSRLCASFYLDDFCKNLLYKINEVEL